MIRRRRTALRATSPNDVAALTGVVPTLEALPTPPGLRPIREGDQNYPTKNELPSMHDQAQEDLESRKRLGIQRYGVALQPANGRDAVRDAYEEALDGAAYGAQAVWEQEHPEHTYVGWLIHELDQRNKRAGISRGESLMYPYGLFIPDGVREHLDSMGYGLFELEPGDS